jgi:hypothetical protein
MDIKKERRKEERTDGRKEGRKEEQMGLVVPLKQQTVLYLGG